MGYIPYIPPPPVQHSYSKTDDKFGFAVWIACHVLPLLVMMTSFVYNKFISKDWRRYDLPQAFEFFSIWFAAVVFIDALILITAIIMLFL